MHTNKLRISFVLGCILCASCVKKGSNVSADNSWNYNGNTYVAEKVVASSFGITALANTSSVSHLVSFASTQTPQKTGWYKIVQSPSADNEISIILGDANGGGYLSVTDTSKAFIRVFDGKMSISATNVKMLNPNNVNDNINLMISNVHQ